MAEKKYKVYYITPFNEDDSLIQGYVKRALETLEVNNEITFNSMDVINFDSHKLNNIFQYIKEADLVVCNISKYNPRVMYELGAAHVWGKASLVLIDTETPAINFDIKGLQFIHFNMSSLSDAFEHNISKAVMSAFEKPDEWSILNFKATKQKKDKKSVFVSYSHKDSSYLKRLQVHLKPLVRKNLIHLWSDEEIASGDKWKKEIEIALEKAAIVLLLISADFLASDFIVNNELQPLLKSVETKGTRIIPVILKPCSFSREESISQFQAINNKPLSDLSKNKQEEVYELISQTIGSELGSV